MCETFQGDSPITRNIFCFFFGCAKFSHSTVLFTLYTNSKSLSSSFYTLMQLLVHFIWKKVKQNNILCSSDIPLFRFLGSFPAPLHAFNFLFLPFRDEYKTSIYSGNERIRMSHFLNSSILKNLLQTVGRRLEGVLVKY